jgi:uncharacterized protein involved in response to NO
VALHAFTAGAMGTLTLGMMARVSLGHTGRMLEPAKLINLSFVLMTAAACIRVFLPVMANAQQMAVMLSGLFWISAFALFVFIYTPILILRRVDGKAG